MRYQDDLGAISCTCVIFERKPVLFVSHAGGDWQMYCHWRNHNFADSKTVEEELKLIHIRHLVSRDPSLNELADLLVDKATNTARQ